MSRHYTGTDHRAGLLPVSNLNQDGPGWTDVMLSAQSGVGAAALTPVQYRGTGLGRYLSWRKGDTQTYVIQFPHEWLTPSSPGASVWGTDVRPHLHWMVGVTPGGARNLRFNLKWAWAMQHQAVPAESSWASPDPTNLTGSAVVDIPIVAGDAFTCRIDGLQSITPPSNARESACLILVVERDNTAADTFTDGVDQVLILSQDSHYRVEKGGTYAEYPGAPP